jgi:ribonuclease BN (tRNA processing enzyme)
MISWTVLGSGTHMASSERGSPGHLVRAGETALLVDCGTGSFHGIARAGFPPEGLDGCLITHLHPDHIADLVPLLFRLRNEAKSGGERALRVYGPPETAGYIEQLCRLHAPYLEHPNLNLTVEEVSDGAIAFPGLVIGAFPVAHALPAVGYSFEPEGGGGRIVYSGDTGRSAELIRRAKGAEILVVEASFPNGTEAEFHLTPEEAAAIAAEADVDTMVLVHLNPEMDGVDLAAQCGERFKGKMIAAADGLEVRTTGDGS